MQFTLIKTLGKFTDAQITPSQLATRLHVDPLIPSVHVASLRHGLFAQSSNEYLNEKILLTKNRQIIHETSIRQVLLSIVKALPFTDYCFLILCVNVYLPIEQVAPSHPSTQVHVYPLFPSVHVAPLRHGLLAHSSVSECSDALL